MRKNSLHLALFILGFFIIPKNELLAQNNTADRDSFLVHGTIEGMDSGKVWLIYKSPDKKDLAYESIVTSGKFQFKGKVPEPAICELRDNELVHGAPFFLENSKITLHLNTTTPTKVDVTGSRSNEAYLEIGKMWHDFFMEGRAIDSTLHVEQNKNNEALHKSLNLKMTGLTKKFGESLKNSLTGGPGDYVILGMLSSILFEPISRTDNEMSKENIKLVGNIISSVNPKIISGIGGKTISKIYEFKKQTQVGQPAPELNLKNHEGKTISLAAYKGRYVLLDFWASFCVPCKDEIYGYTNIYKKFGPEKLEVISVSLDDDSTKWMNAISDNDMRWVNVSVPKGWETSLISPYEIDGAVTTDYLIDKNGIIIAKNIHGNELSKKLDLLLAK